MIDPAQLRGMRLEMEKRAYLGRLGRAFIRSPLKTTGVGAAGGAVLGAGQEALRERQPGEQRSYKDILGGAVRGAVAGGALAGGAAAGGRAVKDTMLLQAAKGAKPTVASGVKGTFGRIGTGFMDFGRRQIHGFTGGQQQAMRAPLQRKQEILRLRGQEASRLGETGYADALKKKVQTVGEELGRREEAMKAGVTSLPGIAKGMVTAPRQTAKGMWRHAIGGGGIGGGAMAIGAPLAFAAPDIARGDESAEGGRTVGQKLVRHGLTAGGMLATGGIPIVPQMLALGGIENLAQRVSGGKKEGNK